MIESIQIKILGMLGKRRIADSERTTGRERPEDTRESSSKKTKESILEGRYGSPFLNICLEMEPITGRWSISQFLRRIKCISEK